MGLMSWTDSKIPAMRWYDISMIKTAVAASILLIAKLWSPILSLEWYWYLIIFVLAMILPMKRVFTKSEVWVKGKSK